MESKSPFRGETAPDDERAPNAAAGKPIVWSIAGTDSGGGAGLAADLRVADAFGVHLCPVVAAVTAQNSVGVARIEPVSAELLDAQLATLARDMPPRAVKTGLLGSVAAVETVARWIDRLRAQPPAGEGTDGRVVALVIDPVLGASTGARFADAAVLQAYRDLLLPRATLITPNRAEAAALLGAASPSVQAVPAMARALRVGVGADGLGADAVCITGGDSPDADGMAIDWIETAHAQGWLALPRIATGNRHGTGCTFAGGAAAALALGFVAADALVLAKMATAAALRHGYAAGAGAGPVHARPGFACDPQDLPRMSFGEAPRFAPIEAVPSGTPTEDFGLYGIVSALEPLQGALAAGIRTLQLRVKAPPQADARWQEDLRRLAAAAIAACRDAGATLFLNDHWRLAMALGADGVHLGQEDLLAMGESDREELARSGIALGVSSHSLWELARARSLAPRYIACGPVWPTTTKDMPWRPQGPANLAWWCAMAGRPVTAIGGILDPEDVFEAARCGAAGVCVVRALGTDPGVLVPPLQTALVRGRHAVAAVVPAMPSPSLRPRQFPGGAPPGHLIRDRQQAPRSAPKPA